MMCEEGGYTYNGSPRNSRFGQICLLGDFFPRLSQLPLLLCPSNSISFTLSSPPLFVHFLPFFHRLLPLPPCPFLPSYFLSPFHPSPFLPSTLFTSFPSPFLASYFLPSPHLLSHISFPPLPSSPSLSSPSSYIPPVPSTPTKITICDMWSFCRFSGDSAMLMVSSIIRSRRSTTASCYRLNIVVCRSVTLVSPAKRLNLSRCRLG